MRRADRNDRKKVIEILMTTFRHNPGVNWMLKKGCHKEKGLSRLAEYAFEKTYSYRGIFISSNEMGVALYYKPGDRKFSVSAFLYQVYFAFTSISLHRLLKVMKRESDRKSFRPLSGNYLYSWFLGVLPGGDRAAFELKNALLEESIKLQVPIYLETSVERNQLVYERLGFKTYHTWIDEKEQICFWFIKRDPVPMSKK